MRSPHFPGGQEPAGVGASPADGSPVTSAGDVAPTAGLTPAELRALDLTVDLVNVVCQDVIGSGRTRAGDVREFVHHVHAIQHVVMAQAAARAHPGLFRLLGEEVAP